MKYLIVATRIALTAFLLFQVYQEAGLWTAFVLTLVFVHAELVSRFIVAINKAVKQIAILAAINKK